MYFKKNIHAASVAILYFFFILNLIFLVVISVDSSLNTIGVLFGITMYMIFIFMPLSIILSIVYLFKKRSIQNFVYLILSFVPTISILLFIYMLGTALSNF